jgi:hypothetical protein
MQTNYRLKATEYTKEEIVEEEKEKRYIEAEEYNDIICDIESDVNDIKNMLLDYDPRNESLCDVLTAIEKLSKNLY